MNEAGARASARPIGQWWQHGGRTGRPSVGSTYLSLDKAGQTGASLPSRYASERNSSSRGEHLRPLEARLLANHRSAALRLSAENLRGGQVEVAPAAGNVAPDPQPAPLPPGECIGLAPLKVLTLPPLDPTLT